MRTLVDFSYHNRRFTGDRLVRIGDAAAFLDPIFSSGVYLAMLSAKTAALAVADAIDRGVPFENTVICERCRSVFASLDLAHEVCRDLASDALPEDVRVRLNEVIASEKPLS